jgi:hypothetical protein
MTRVVQERGKENVHRGVLVGKLKERNNLENLAVNGRIILK